MVHGDDYASEGSIASLRWLKDRQKDIFDMKTVNVGQGGAANIVKEEEILNQMIRATPEGREYECDQRHAELTIEVHCCKTVDMPQPGRSGVQVAIRRGNPVIGDWSTSHSSPAKPRGHPRDLSSKRPHI